MEDATHVVKKLYKKFRKQSSRQFHKNRYEKPKKNEHKQELKCHGCGSPECLETKRDEKLKDKKKKESVGSLE